MALTAAGPIGGPAMRFTEVHEYLGGIFANDNSYVFEQKFDGTRLLVEIEADGIEYYQSNGNPLKHSASLKHLETLTKQLQPLQEACESSWKIVLDGELLIRSGELCIFDVPLCTVPLSRVDGWTKFSQRREVLETLVRSKIAKANNIFVVQQAKGSAQKLEMFAAAQRALVEGVVVKDLRAPYEVGKRVKHVMKIKFVKTADVIVTAVNRPDVKHGNFEFGVYRDMGTGGPRLYPLGKCSAIGKPAAEVGDVIEVAYLYREPTSGGLVQPRMVRVREDKTPAECTLDQFPEYSREAINFARFSS